MDIITSNMGILHYVWNDNIYIEKRDKNVRHNQGNNLRDRRRNYRVVTGQFNRSYDTLK